METKFTGLIYTSAGIFIGWVLTQFSAWYKGMKEDNRIRNQVLFNLLEVHNLLERITNSSIKNFEIIAKKVIELVPELENTLETRNEINEVLGKMFKPILKKIFTDQINEIDSGYKLAIQSLAPVDPLIAYYLNGKTSALKQMESYVAAIIDQVAATGMQENEINKAELLLSETLHDKVYQNSIKEIKDLTIDVASGIGIRTKWRVKKLLQKPFFSEDDNNELNDAIDQYTRIAIQQFQLSNINLPL